MKRLYDKLTSDFQTIVAVGVPHPHPNWPDEHKRDPAAFYSLATPEKKGQPNVLADTPANRDLLDHVWFVHEDMPDVVPDPGFKLGEKVPAIDGAAGMVRWSKAVAEMSPAEVDAETAKNLQTRKLDMTTAAKQKFADIVAGGFWYTVPGQAKAHVYDIHTEAQNNMNSVQTDFLKGNTNAHGGEWTDASASIGGEEVDVPVTISDIDVQVFFDAAKAYKQTAYKLKVALKLRIAYAADDAALDLIDVDAGTAPETSPGAGDALIGWPPNS